MTAHHRILILILEEVGHATSDYLSSKSKLPHAAVLQAMLELCHKKMAKHDNAVHIDVAGNEKKLFIYRIKPRGREMCQRIRNAAAVGEDIP